MTADAEKSFHDLRLHPEEDMYIQLNFQMMPPSPEYLAVLEENPYMPKYLQISEKDKLIAEDIVSESLYSFQVEQLKKQIDQAIDDNNKEKFMELSSLWKQIQQKEV